jgi:hypothetical protein
MKIKFTSRGIPELQAFLKKLPFLVRQKAAGWVSEYIVGNDIHGLRHYPAYKFVSRKAAYGYSFVSDKQRRWFFANLREGNIHPGQDNRTGATAAAWQFKPTGAGAFQVSNDAPGAPWTMGNETQARQPAMVGWRKWGEVVQSNLKGAFRHAQAQVKAWLKTVKK